MKTYSFFLIVVIFLSTFVSCKKDSNAPPSQNPEVIPLTGDTILYLIKKNNIKNKELTYNSNKTINSIICYNDTGAFSYGAAYNYNLPGKVLYIYNTYANSAYNSYDSCCYNSYDLLTKIYTYSTSAFIYMQNLQYNSDGKLVGLFLLYGGTVNGLNFIYDSNFNVVKEYDSGDAVCDTTYYVYDNKKSIYIKGMPCMTASQLSGNNIVQKIHHDPNGNPKPSDSYNAVFEYNSKGLPVKETRTYLNNVVEVYEFFYQ